MLIEAVAAPSNRPCCRLCTCVGLGHQSGEEGKVSLRRSEVYIPSTLGKRASERIM